MSKPARSNVRPAAWIGARGEWYVVAQVLLIGLTFLGPRRISGADLWPFAESLLVRAGGAALMLTGAALLVAGLVRLGRGLTPVPYPKDGAVLECTGAFGLVRHPIYGGGIVLAFGWAFVVQSGLTLAYAAALFVLLDAKSRREERWLGEKFPEYAEYRKHVRRLIPFVY